MKQRPLPQIAVNEEINQSVISINDMAKQTSGGAEQTAAASEELAQLAKDLNSLVAQFKI
jgi:methyl-accepting chemotaxis protein